LTVEGLAAAESTGATSGADQRGPTRSWAVHGCMETTSFESASGGYATKVEHAASVTTVGIRRRWRQSRNSLISRI
ncbi:hypothetical protein Dimus_036077, partial [Dionaea muscipula]